MASSNALVTGTLRVTQGPQAERFAPEAWDLLMRTAYTVKEDSDRMGLRLRGARMAQAPSGGMVTQGVPPGAVQVPPGGEPIILFVDQQTTGGYPVIASVISADLTSVAQLRPQILRQFRAAQLTQCGVYGEHQVPLGIDQRAIEIKHQRLHMALKILFHLLLF